MKRFFNNAQNHHFDTAGSRELGFGTKATEQGQRLINGDGSFNLKREGLPFFRSYELYHKLISMSWTKFLLLVVSGYVLVNILFAFIYLGIGIEHLTGIEKSSLLHNFGEAFFFSSQSITTVGYGRIAPLGASASAVAAVESMIGLLGFALVTGLLYGRFSRPQAKILYSNNAIVAPYKNSTGFMFRIANKRDNLLIEAEAQLLVALKIEKDGKFSRVFKPLSLELNKINFFNLSWTVVHPINEESPLYGITSEDLKESDAEFIILIKAFDDTFSQTVYSRSSYKYDEVIFDVKYVPMISYEKGINKLHLNKISEVEKVV